MNQNRLNIVAAISGGGSTMGALNAACKVGEVNGSIVGVIASKQSAGGIEKAIAQGIPVKVLKLHADFGGNEKLFGEAILRFCNEVRADFFAQLGWLPHTPENVIRAFRGRIINQHPGPLDPGRLGFGGKDMHGLAVHKAVIDFHSLLAGKRVFRTEATVQRVALEVDEGQLLDTAPLDILTGDTPESLAARLLFWEHHLVITTCRRFAHGKVQELQRSQPLIMADEVDWYHQAMAAGRAYHQQH